MDTLEEENSVGNAESESFLCPPDIVIDRVTIDENIDNCKDLSMEYSGHSSRRSSCSERRKSSILIALRRPSQHIALSVAQAVMRQTRLYGTQKERAAETENEERLRIYNKRLGNDSLTTVLSALYGKLLVVLGIAFPITEIISHDVRPFFYQGFYVYLYVVSILFIAFMNASVLKKDRIASLLRMSKVHSETTQNSHANGKDNVRYGSFYLRVGAIAFGIGNMVYSGLEFGRYFDVRSNSKCNWNIMQATTPALRMVLTIIQIQFIFLHSRKLEMNRHKIISRFGLMHMIGANLCEWLYVVVEETKHEIIHLADHNNSTMYFNGKYCPENEIMGSLLADASSFLFPCTIEYSLICAVILYEMWKKIKTHIERKPCRTRADKEKHMDLNHFVNPHKQSGHHFTVDCSNAHKGLFAGMIVIVVTIISLIMFFVLAKDKKLAYKNAAEFEVNIMELTLYIITTMTTIWAIVQMKDLQFKNKEKCDGTSGLGLDNTLLVLAQTGVFIYSIFSMIGSYFTLPSPQSSVGLMAEIFSFIQTCLQTIFVLDGWRRRCSTLQQVKDKPGREMITFLIIANMAMWSINALEKNRAEFKPTHLEFFGDWAWTIITHVSMPLAIFYRFHSTICLFEIWKNAYKIKSLDKLKFHTFR